VDTHRTSEKSYVTRPTNQTWFSNLLGEDSLMTQPRRQLVDPKQAGAYHCVSRCVRRAWLCGVDPYNGQSYEHRKHWVEKRILQLGEIFACGVYAYAVMSNHLHLVVHMSPQTAQSWSALDVASRWCALYPARTNLLHAEKIERIAASIELVELYRWRLCNLSWLMKSLSEPLARRANAEDEVTGKFWEGRFKCQLLLGDKSMLAAMTYVDLNPVRAKIAGSVSTSMHTSARKRGKQIRGEPTLASKPLQPIAGVKMFTAPLISVAQYIDLVDWTGRQWHPTKRGKIARSEPNALTKLGLNPDHWTHKVKGIGSGFWRVVGSMEDLTEKARELKQRTLYGTGLAKILSKI
jgi:hypothetical protein